MMRTLLETIEPEDHGIWELSRKVVNVPLKIVFSHMNSGYIDSTKQRESFA